MSGLVITSVTLRGPHARLIVSGNCDRRGPVAHATGVVTLKIAGDGEYVQTGDTLAIAYDLNQQCHCPRGVCSANS
jgi:hypothetical protein